MFQSARALTSVSRNGSASVVSAVSNGGLKGCEAIRSCFDRSASTNQNTLSLMIGPPARPPNCSRSNGGGVAPGSAAEVDWLRNNPKSCPCMLLVPERVLTLTAPEEVSSLERSSEDCDSWNS